MPTVLITGANRGIGLEFARQYAGNGWSVVATCRDPARAPAALTDLEGVRVEALDVADFDAVAAFGAKMAGEALDLLISNAGIYGDRAAQQLGALDAAVMADVLRVNTIAPAMLVQALLPALRQAEAPKVAILSSKVGSIADNTSGGNYAYRASKAGVNAVGKSLSLDLAGDGIAVVLLHPGWVRTDMGGPNGLIDTSESVSGLRKVIDATTPETSGRFFDYAGKEIPW